MDRKSVLIIEDEMIHGMLLKSSIENSGYRVLDIISRGEDAVLAAIDHKPDLIITDILLKGTLSGVEAIEQILCHINIPFIFLTAISDSRIMNKATNTSPSAIINKPYDMKILLETIDSLLKN
ncbi:MAG TPA: response regulator [Spirochaetota bacterium]|nr:response regulator [Spirochaetota bacterium]HPS87540.1 response regulator [Spirochaetota bacterium]